MASGLHVEQVLRPLLDERSTFLGFVRRRIADREQAEDLLQAAYMRALEHAPALRDPGTARAWFYRVLRNAIIDHYRSRVRENAVVSTMPEGLDAAAPVTEASNVCRCIDRAVARLKPEYAEVLREVELSEDGTVAGYAERAGMTAGNAAVRAFRARKALAKSLAHTCGSCAGAGCLDCSCASSAQA